MKGVQAYELRGFHDTCESVDVVEIGGLAYLYCRRCRVLTNLQAVAPKLQSYDEAQSIRKNVPSAERLAGGK